MGGELVADMAVVSKEVKAPPRAAPGSIDGDAEEEPCTEDIEMSCCAGSCGVNTDPPVAGPALGLEIIALSRLSTGKLPMASVDASLLRNWPWRGVGRSDCSCSVNIDNE